ncbi:Luciferase-like monooxygenase [Belnapia rosea]|uniref:Luciferase-like monooxygenase n=2 Tax=Belnapia rosea TaxID=938405 RepID=A0A1G7E1Z0_9PROT|nr:Luciferase-like monooxygenase [Belnapia rosea]
MALPPRIGFHASHEQFSPSELLAVARAAEQTGFDCAMSSDHFRPWGLAQGHSGFAWSWLGAAMATTRLPFLVISAPGYRYHPAIWISSDLGWHAARIAELAELGFDEIQLHQVGRNQQAFIDAFGGARAACAAPLRGEPE